MHQRIRPRSSRGAIALLRFLLMQLLLVGIANVCCAANNGVVQPPIPPQPEIRSGGVIEESYNYHRQHPARMAGTARSVEPAGGWYGYGFPVSTFRWGWFGASHYYPTVWWHDGYYNDCCRYGYRRGY